MNGGMLCGLLFSLLSPPPVFIFNSKTKNTIRHTQLWLAKITQSKAHRIDSEPLVLLCIWVVDQAQKETGSACLWASQSDVTLFWRDIFPLFFGGWAEKREMSEGHGNMTRLVLFYCDDRIQWRQQEIHAHTEEKQEEGEKRWPRQPCGSRKDTTSKKDAGPQ